MLLADTEGDSLMKTLGLEIYLDRPRTKNRELRAWKAAQIWPGAHEKAI